MPNTKSKRAAAATTTKAGKRKTQVTTDIWIDDDAVDGMRMKKGGRSVCHLDDFDDLEQNGDYSPSTAASSFTSSSYSPESSSDEDLIDAYATKQKQASGKKAEGAASKRAGHRAPSQCGYDDRAASESKGKKKQTSKQAVMKSRDAEVRRGEGEFRIVDEAARKRRDSMKQAPSDPPKNLSRRMSYKVHHPRYSPLISPIHAVKLTFTPKTVSEHGEQESTADSAKHVQTMTPKKRGKRGTGGKSSKTAKQAGSKKSKVRQNTKKSKSLSMA